MHKNVTIMKPYEKELKSRTNSKKLELDYGEVFEIYSRFKTASNSYLTPGLWYGSHVVTNIELGINTYTLSKKLTYELWLHT